MWNVIQTLTGKELELVSVINKVLDKSSYESCFVLQRECVWRIQGCLKIHIEPLFPSYVFVETDTPEQFFLDLKRVPRLTKLLGAGGMFWNVSGEEEDLLRKLIGADPEYVVRRSPVEVNENGEIVSAKGVLEEHVGKIVRKRLRKRIVVIEIPFLGEMRRIEVGVKIFGDKNEPT